MSGGPRRVSKDDIVRAFSGENAEKFPSILTPSLLAALLGLRPKTIYYWIAKGRLDGAFRKRGKHVLIWRDSAVDLLFNGRDWID